LPNLLGLLQVAHVCAPCCVFSYRCWVFLRDFAFPPPVLSDIPVSQDTFGVENVKTGKASAL